MSTGKSFFPSPDGDGRSSRALALLLVLCLLAWLPGFFTIPALDRDESRFAQASKQMLETHDFIDINLGAGPRYEKPVGIYWLQAASTAILGDGARDRIWTYRMPSLLGALAAVAATFLIARTVAGVEAGFYAGLLLGFSLLLASESHIAKTDAVLLATTVAAQAMLMRTYLSARQALAPPRRRSLILGWVAFGIGVLVKGPVIALVCGASVLAVSLWDRDFAWFKRTRPLTGLALCLLIVLPWAVAIGLASHGQFYEKSLGKDFAMKIIGDQDAHGAPPGYYTLLAHLTFWPGSLVLIPALIAAFEWRREPAIRYLLAWIVTTWLMFELAPTKLPHYVLPAYPALAVLAGLWLISGKASSRAQRIGGVISLSLFALIGLAIALFLCLSPGRLGAGSPWWLYGLSIAGSIAVLVATVLNGRGRRRAALVAACASAFILYNEAQLFTVPRLDQIWLSSRMAEAVHRNALAGDPPTITAGYAEPSIAFLLGTRTALLDGARAGENAAAMGGLVLVARPERTAFLAATQKSGAQTQALDEIDGLDYSTGRLTEITLYRVDSHAK